MNSKNINNFEIDSLAESRKVELVPLTPISYTINTYTVNINQGTESAGDVAYCDVDRSIHCNISITPGAKYKTIKRVLLLLRHRSGAQDGFTAHTAFSNTLVDSRPFAYVENRLNTNNEIAYRVIDITSLINGTETQTIHIAIKNTNGELATVNTNYSTLEIEYLEDDDFIENVAKLERKVGSKGAYSVNTRNGKLFYTQSLINAKGGRMPLSLSMTYNAADCDTSSPNGISAGMKGWTFNYGQTLNISASNYTLLDGTHMYRTFKPTTNNSAIKYDASGKGGMYLTEPSNQYAIIDAIKSKTYRFDNSKRLVSISATNGASSSSTSIFYNDAGQICSISDGMSDIYTFTYGTNIITISRGAIDLVRITLENERVTKVLYMQSGEEYTFTYNSNGELTTINDSASNEMTKFEYTDAPAVSIIENRVCPNGAITDCYFIHYKVLKTLISKCRNSNSESEKYSTTVYVFAENGETISTYENGESGAFSNTRFKSKNDYEKYVTNIIDIAASESETKKKAFTFNSETICNYTSSTLNGIVGINSDTIAFDTTDSKSKNIVFTAKALINANNYIEDKEQQSFKVLFTEGSNALCTLDFDAERRDYQVAAEMITLPRGTHNLQACVIADNMRVEATVFDIAVFETDSIKYTEYITELTDSSEPIEEDADNILWYANKGGLEIVAGGVLVENVTFTYKDYVLTTISRLKDPAYFNVWYNDGKNMFAQVSAGYLAKNSVTQNIASVKCATVTRDMGKTTITTIKPSSASDCLFDVIKTTRIEKDDGTDELVTSTTSYNGYMKPVKVVNEENIVTEYTYNEFGELLTEKTYPTSNVTMYTIASREYDQRGNLASVTEKRDGHSYSRVFEYNGDDTLKDEITANGQYINYEHTPDGEKLLEMNATVDGNLNKNLIAYTGNLIQSLSHNNTATAFGYDDRNNVMNVIVAGALVLSRQITYLPQGNQALVSYKNGYKIKKYYDKYNRLIKVTEVETGSDGNITSETQLCAYLYSDSEVEYSVTSPEDITLKRTASSKLRVFIDNIANKRTTYIYDEYGNLKEKKIGAVSESVTEKDSLGRVTKTVFAVNGGYSNDNAVEYENNHSNAIKNETVTLEGASTKIAYARDALKRLTSISTTQDGIGYKRTYGYVPRGAASSPDGTTNYIKSVSYYNVLNNASSFEKTENVAYNNDGNIVTYGENTYVYDRIGRLVRENNKALDKTYTFEYNEGGNIVSKNEYVYTEELVLGTPTKIYAYTYGNGWKDQLSSFDGSTITYDIVGNPTSYLGVALTWTRGRLLYTYSKGRTLYTMNYNARGVRTSKIKETPSFNGINLETTNYTYDSEGRLRRETKANFERIYLYSSDGIIGYEENGERFIYRKNLFGDITAIYQGSTKVAEYVYDAWGNCTITYDPDGYGASNPIRYRGYYWDSDIKMYYLMTRYYDPKIGRFINADTLDYLDPKTINGLNLYSYCGNNPVMNIDITGSAYKRISNLALPLYSINPTQSQGFSADASTAIFGRKFEYGLVTPSKYPNERMLTYAFYIKGNVGLDYSQKDGYSFLSLRMGVLDATVKTDKFFNEDALINPNAFFDIGALNVGATVGLGITGVAELVSAGVGIQIGDVFSVSLKGYVGAAFVLDFTNGIEIGGGFPVGLILSINFDWLSLLLDKD